MNVDLSIVIPCFNESESIPHLMRELGRVFPEEGPVKAEFVIVDDGSDDGSYEILRRFMNNEPRLKAIRRPARGGQTAALWEGLEHAGGRWVAHLDCDLQNDPADIPAMLNMARRGYDAVFGYREVRRDSISRRLASGLANKIRRAVLHDTIRDIGCSTRVVRMEALKAVPPLPDAHRYLPALLEAMGCRIVQVPSHHGPRRFGRSKYGVLGRGMRGIVDLIRIARYVRRQRKTNLGGEKP